MNDKISTSEGDRIEQESLKSKTEKENVILTSDNLPDIHQPSTLQEDRSHINGKAEGKSVDPTLATHENEGAADEDMNMDTGTSLTGNIPKQNEQDRSSNNSNSEVSKTDDKDKGQLKGDIVTPADDDLQRDQGTQSSTQLDVPTENLQETSENSEKHENNKDEVKSDTDGGIQDEKKDQSNNPQENNSDNHLLAEDGSDDKSKSTSTTSYQDPNLEQVDANNDDNSTVFAGESSVEDTDKHLRETSQTDLDIHGTHGESNASVVHLGYGSVEEQNGLSSTEHGNFDRNFTNDTKLTIMERQEEQHQSDTMNTNGVQASNNDTQQDIEQDPSQNNSGRMHENETDQGKADDTDDQREHSNIRNDDGENDFKYDSDKKCKGMTAAVNGGLNECANGSDKEVMPKIEDQNTNETNRESTVKGNVTQM